MPKILVTYFSQTGNTKAVAEAIHEALEGEKSIKPLQQVEEQDIERSSLIFIGFPVHTHSVPYKMESFLRKLPQGKKIALFSTHGSLSGSSLSREALQHASVLTSQARVLGTFSCRGKVSPKALELLSQTPEHRAWTEMAVTARTHPDDDDFEDARAFARWMMTIYHQS